MKAPKVRMPSISVSASTRRNKTLVEVRGLVYIKPRSSAHVLSLRLTMKRRVVLSLLCAVALLAGNVQAYSAAAQGPIAIGNGGRVRVNFNAAWRFKLGQSAAAEQPNFDDSAWEFVGL